MTINSKLIKILIRASVELTGSASLSAENSKFKIGFGFGSLPRPPEISCVDTVCPWLLLFLSPHIDSGVNFVGDDVVPREGEIQLERFRQNHAFDVDTRCFVLAASVIDLLALLLIKFGRSRVIAPCLFEQNLQFDIANGWLEFWNNTHVFPLTRSDLWLSSNLFCIDLLYKSIRHGLQELNSLIQQMEISLLRYFTSLLVLWKQACFSSYRECAWRFVRCWLLCTATNATSRCFPRQRELCLRSFQQHDCDIVRSCFELYASDCYALLHLESLLSEVGLPMLSRECNTGILLDDPTTFEAVFYDALSSFLCIWHGLSALPKHIQEMELLTDQRLLHIFVRCRTHVSTLSALTALYELLLQQNFSPISRQRHVLCVSCERSASSSFIPRQEELCFTLTHSSLEFPPLWFVWVYFDEQQTVNQFQYCLKLPFVLLRREFHVESQATKLRKFTLELLEELNLRLSPATRDLPRDVIELLFQPFLPQVHLQRQSRYCSSIKHLLLARSGWFRSILDFLHCSLPRPPEDLYDFG